METDYGMEKKTNENTKEKIEITAVRRKIRRHAMPTICNIDKI